MITELTSDRFKKERDFYSMYPGKKSFGAVVLMSPRDFIALCPHSDDAIYRADNYGLFNESLYMDDWLPYLELDKNENVIGHEGRARAILADRAGYTHIHVIHSTKLAGISVKEVTWNGVIPIHSGEILI